MDVENPYYGSEDKHHRRIHEVVESFFGRTNKEKDLKNAYGQAGYPHWHYFKDPPCCRQQGYS